MKNLILILVAFLISSQFLYGQTNQQIVLWLNSFEDSNSPERIMAGTTEDKVFLEYQDSILIINSMVQSPFGGYPSKIKTYIRINNIIQIEAKEKIYGNNIICDLYICTKPNSIKMYWKNTGDKDFVVFPIEQKMLEKNGYCSTELRFKFPSSNSQDEIDRIYNALKQLCKNHGSEPKIGPYF